MSYVSFTGCVARKGCALFVFSRYKLRGVYKMSVYELDKDEIVIMQENNVSEGKQNVALILTNKSIIQVNKKTNFWGNDVDKDSVKYSLLELKDNNGKPNILIGKDADGKTRLELYFSGYEKYYVFEAWFAERKWAGAIEKAYIDYCSDKSSNSQTSNIGAVFAPIAGLFGARNNSGTVKNKITKCPKCGAELSGDRGKEVKCDYCDTVVLIK